MHWLKRFFGKDIYSFCLYVTLNKENAEELYQQTFLVAVEKGELDEIHQILDSIKIEQ